MKILSLHIENLNSLYGKWHIDFTHPGFQAEGLFAITGPTGAGKSTILDALCLALYGATPRLGRITKSNNQLMSRQTGECSAELVFQTPEGIFRCYWGQHRARKKADGKLAEARHEISNAETGEILCDKKRETEAKVEEITGMDFQRFTRSILLAQGSFDAFLKADADQRSPILEQITGTEIYSTFSVFLHERLRREKEQWQLLQAESAGIELLSPEKEQELEARLLEGRSRESELRRQIEENTRALRKLEERRSMEQEKAKKEAQLQTLRQEQEAFAPRRKQWQEAQKAAELEGGFAGLESLRQQCLQKERDRQDLAGEILSLEQQASEDERADQQAQEALNQARQQHEKDRGLLRELRDLDSRLAGLKESLEQSRQDQQRQAEQLDRMKASESETLQKQNSLNGEIEALDAWSREQRKLDGLEEEMTGLRELLSRQKSSIREQNLLEEKRQQLKAEEDRRDALLKEARQALESQKQAVEKAEAAIRSKEVALKELLQDRSLKEIRREQEGLLRETALIQKILRLEEEREKLIQGEPCPLCGSEDHPYARGEQPEAPRGRLEELGALLQQAEELQEKIEESRQQLEAERLHLARVEKEELQASSAASEIRRDRERLEQDLQHLKEQKQEGNTRLQQRFQTLGLDGLMPQDQSTKAPEVLEKELEDLLGQWKNRKEQRRQMEEQRLALESSLNSQRQTIESLEPELQRLKEKNAALEAQMEKQEKERRDRFGNMTAELMEQEADGLLEAAQQSRNRAAEKRTVTLEQLQSRREQLKNLDRAFTELEEERKRVDKRFSDHCSEAGFPTKEAWIAARMPAEERRGLEQQAAEMDRRQNILEFRLQELGLALQEESDLLNLEELEATERRKKEQEEQLKALLEQSGALSQQLKDHREKTALLKDKKEALDKAAAECRRWERLHALIGSSDGKKYRNFAQGLTFERMVGLANRQLRKMSDRYLLLRDEEAPLELNVIDNYQGGEIRSTRNLSGGESFLVSLALALGLSGLSSRKVQMESLFLDEGFGTLDEDSLETALETLSELQQQGKLIGIISHVPVIRERLGTQILVQRSSAGRSRLSGPGCQRVTKPADI